MSAACGAALIGDHPRACGEKPRAAALLRPWWGSPPRMRGKVPISPESLHRRGITPAHAGKSCPCPRPPVNRWDHPRACGEKKTGITSRRLVRGSPPRMRGKEGAVFPRSVHVGITPAHAGKRRSCKTCPFPAWDHPRACGEKWYDRSIQSRWPGSPPRMRGKAFQIRHHRLLPGITPAHAGKSIQVDALSTASGDHPRACGEKRDWSKGGFGK